ncbi:MAG: Glycosyl transferase group 2 family protein, partial [Rhodospirillaceae bacterium]
DQAVPHAFRRLDELRHAYPGKRIVVAEFGWPSNGANELGAKADPILQGQVIREFLAETRRRGIEYNVVEAFDQPWKDFENHGVGPYWGVFDADRQIKFSLTGPVEEQTDRPLAGASLAAGLMLTLLGLLRRRVTFGHALAYALAAHALGVGLVMAVAYPFLNYMNGGIWVMWGLGPLPGRGPRCRSIFRPIASRPRC